MKIDLSSAMDNLKEIEQVADQVLLKRLSQRSLITAIEHNLGKASNGKTRFHVTILNNMKSKSSFVMGCYPDPEELKSRCPSLVEALNENKMETFLNIWSDIVNWHIEIDGRTLSSKSNIRFDNGRQFVAVLCHELGHISHTHPYRLFANYRMRRATFSIYDKTIMKSPILALLFLPMLVCAEGFKIVITKPFHDINEIQADLFVPMEYKQDLIDYSQNHIIPHANKKIIMTNEEFDAQQGVGIEFSHSCIRLMKKRRAALKVALKNQYKITESPYYKKICSMMSSIVSSEDMDSGKTNLTRDKYLGESFDRADQLATKEAKMILEGIRVTERDILLISTQADVMKTVDDKAYLINTICDFEEALIKQKAKQMKKLKDVDVMKEDPIVDPKLRQLAKLKQKVMDTPVTNGVERYGVFIKYPEGYEG